MGGGWLCSAGAGICRRNLCRAREDPWKEVRGVYIHGGNGCRLGMGAKGFFVLDEFAENGVMIEDGFIQEWLMLDAVSRIAG